MDAMTDVGSGPNETMTDDPTPEVRIRKRVRINPDAPPPIPERPGHNRWPNGSAVFTQGGVRDPRQHLGWVLRGADGQHRTFRRTGPDEAQDIAFIGVYASHHEAFSALPGKPWSDGHREPRIRGRVRAPAADPASEAEPPVPIPSDPAQPE